MATRSRIGIENQDGTISSIYCHYDSYESGVGAVLKNHYTGRGKVQSLIDLGDISSLGERVAPLVNTNEMLHTFDNPIPGITVAYHRDRGEELYKARVDTSLESFSKSDFEEYGRVFNLEGEWITFK